MSLPKVYLLAISNGSKSIWTKGSLSSNLYPIKSKKTIEFLFDCNFMSVSKPKVSKIGIFPKIFVFIVPYIYYFSVIKPLLFFIIDKILYRD